MEKHRCKLCHRNFANGRALGGHMRSHMMNLYASSKAKNEFVKQQQHHDDDDDHREGYLMSEEIESVPSSSEDEEDIEGNGMFSCGMSTNHHNLKKRRGGGGGGMVAMADSDHQFCFGGAAEAAGSVVLQDRESETESSRNPIRRRSRRVRKSRISDAIQFSEYNSSIKQSPQEKKPKSLSQKKQGMVPPSESVLETEQPVSSISDTTPEEDVAHCLMMLSRDKWLRRNTTQEEEEEEEGFYAEEEEQEEEGDDDHQEEDEEDEKKRKKKMYYCHDFGELKVTKSSRSRGGKYRCETCKKVFRSYQALGGHRASHKRIKGQNCSNNSTEEQQTGMMMKLKQQQQTASSVIEEKIHECPVCYRVFSSGQALGGHKRSHVMGAAAAANQHHHHHHHHHLIHVSTNTTTTTTDSTIDPVSSEAKKQPISSRFGESFIDLNLPAPVEEEDDVSQIELSAVSDAEFVNPFKH